MIFLSHQTKDKEFVRQFAIKLAEKFGKERIFYDEWNIRPGDSIPGEMSKGLENMTHFFYFLTENSLQSVMVEAEWHVAFMKQAKDKNIKFVVVRADDVNPPALLEPLRFIDLYMQGEDVALEEIISSVTGEFDDFKHEKFNNRIAYSHVVSESTIHFYVTAKRFYIPNAPFILATDCKEYEATFEPGWPCMNANDFLIDMFRDGETNGFLLDVQTGIRPKNYLKLIFTKNKDFVTIKGLYHLKTQTQLEPFEIVQINSESELP